MTTSLRRLAVSLARDRKIREWRSREKVRASPLRRLCILLWRANETASYADQLTTFYSFHRLDIVSCEAMNNCSNHGNCTGPNECTCEKGFQAEADCSKGTMHFLFCNNLFFLRKPWLILAWHYFKRVLMIWMGYESVTRNKAVDVCVNLSF